MKKIYYKYFIRKLKLYSLLLHHVNNIQENEDGGSYSSSYKVVARLEEKDERNETENYNYLNLSHFQSIIEQLVFCVSKLFPTYNPTNTNNTDTDTDIKTTNTCTTSSKEVGYLYNLVNIYNALRIILVAPLLLSHKTFTQLSINSMLFRNEKTQDNKYILATTRTATKTTSITSNDDPNKSGNSSSNMQSNQELESLKKTFRLPLYDILMEMSPPSTSISIQQIPISSPTLTPSPLLDNKPLPKLLRRRHQEISLERDYGNGDSDSDFFKQFDVIIVSIIDFMAKISCFHAFLLSSIFMCSLFILLLLLPFCCLYLTKCFKILLYTNLVLCQRESDFQKTSSHTDFYQNNLQILQISSSLTGDLRSSSKQNVHWPLYNLFLISTYL